MRREDRDELLRGFLAINAMLREATKSLRRAMEARRDEAKHNPNWRLQPRAPRGQRDGGQWIDKGGSHPKGGGNNNRRSGSAGGARGIGDNRPPSDTLQEIFNVPPSAPANAILAPVDEFLGLSAARDGAVGQATRNLANSYVREIRSIDPHLPIPRAAEP